MNCPICGKPPAEKYSPFCSRRCADVDLGKWLTGSYAIPVEDTEDEPADPGSEHGADEGKPH
ncbi:MAG: DNA gyrase inhibitor YacG [Rhodobacteraceae bacterium]|jgi:endogenous inhibitor of DNA gyrase (YacG/DUF329 family)|nr:DNA gyrase inhibitor YacG [Paracoccaceae bacterium]